MQEFRWISVVMAMILGLGVTRLLTGLIAVFRSRLRAEIDWLPVAWAVSIFMTQLQFWWGMNKDAVVIARWTFMEFTAAATLPMMLFVTAALLLPPNEMGKGDSLRRFFQVEGRFALVALALYNAMTIGANVILFGASPFALWALADVPMIVLPLLAFFAARRAIGVAATLLYLPWALFDAIWISDYY